MIKRFHFILVLFLGFCITCLSQNNQGFKFHKPDKKRYKIGFVNYNNLIIIKVKLNNRSMNFLVDTGVDKTVLFGLEGDEESIKKNSTKILIRGVSGNKKTYAYKNENNLLEIGKLKDTSHDIYAIFDKDFNISDKIGYQVQGILGYNFFKDVIVKINYKRDFIKIYNPKNFSKALRSYESIDLKLYKQKPYIETQLKQKGKMRSFLFLLDTGSGDAIWVQPQPDTRIPEKNFDDILGYGFADIIKGKRSKADAFNLGSYQLKSPKIAYPDTLAYSGLEFTSKSGVIGSEIMRRFHWVMDYTNKKVYFKKNNDFSDPFNYDMSGLILKYDGYQIITSYVNVFSRAKAQTDNSAGYNKIADEPDFYIDKRPILRVGAVRPNSSAFEAGFVEGDEIVSINSRASHKYDLQEIMKIFSSEEGRIINFEIRRGGRLYEKSLRLKSRFLE